MAGNEQTASLSFRADNVGGEVVAPSGQTVAAIVNLVRSGPGRGVVLLIHGYNNSAKDARRAYDGFFRMQREVSDLQEKEHRRLADNRVFLEVFWPGDADWGILSFAFYMGSIAHAIQTSALLADVLKTVATEPMPLEVDIVGHSMGCRLALETFAALGPAARVQVRSVALMAAAVPTFMLTPSGALRSAYDAQVGNSGGRVLSLYSAADMVLALAFPVGQTLASNGNGVFPTALGHDRWTSPSAPGSLQQEEVPRAGHSDYWGWKERTLDVARIANKYVADWLGFNHASPYAVEDRTVASATVESRTLPSGREVATFVPYD